MDVPKSSPSIMNTKDNLVIISKAAANIVSQWHQLTCTFDPLGFPRAERKYEVQELATIFLVPQLLHQFHLLRCMGGINGEATIAS